MYSRADKVVDILKLEGLIKARQRSNTGVRSFSVNDAPHVGLLMKYPQEYSQTLSDFVRESLLWRSSK